jgi:RNA-directed DNA polymerase
MIVAAHDPLKRMRQVVRSWRIHRRRPATLEDIAQLCNPTTQGWWNHYGALYRSEMRKLFHYIDQKLAQWARRKYKTLRRRKQRSVRWLGKMMELAPRLFVHWRITRREVGSREPD